MLRARACAWLLREGRQQLQGVFWQGVRQQVSKVQLKVHIIQVILRKVLLVVLSSQGLLIHVLCQFCSVNALLGPTDVAPTDVGLRR